MSDPIDQLTSSYDSIQDEQYSDYVAVRDRLREFYSDGEAELWLASSHPQLGGQSALSLINRGEKARVHEIIDRLETDVYL